MRVRGAGLIVLALLTKITVLNAQTTTPTSAGSRGTGRSLTIREAEAIAVQRNPNITVGKLQALQAHEFVREVRSAFYSNVDLNAPAVDSDPGSRISAGYLNNPVI